MSPDRPASAVEELESSSPDLVGSVLVAGGGIGGMQAALDLADAGFHVQLVTKDYSIGGIMAQLDKTFPTNDCAMCLLGPKMTDCDNHPNIDIIPNAEVTGLEGEPGRFRARVLRHPRYVDIDECTACGECVDVCPVLLPNPFNQDMDVITAIRKPYPQAIPNAFLVEKSGVSPCTNACPASVNAHGYVALMSQGRFREALDVVRRRMPFASVCGRICHHPCEDECNRQDLDDPVSISRLKRAAVDFAIEDEESPQPPLTPEKIRDESVAVVGAGPAGLAAALDLVAKGFRVKVYDAAPEPGGAIRASIPRYRLSQEALDQDLSWIMSAGMEFVGDTHVGQDVTLDQLKEEHRAVVVAVGAGLGRGLNLPGSDSRGVLLGLDFLNQANLQPDDPPQVGSRVVVIGGGNVAMDTARTALRLGAREVHAVCLEAPDEMPAHSWEIEEAVEEGVTIHNSWGPVEFETSGGQVSGVRMARCTSVFDQDGRFNPRLDESDIRVFEADTVIVSIGQMTDNSVFSGLEERLTDNGRPKVDSGRLTTPVDGIFMAGDMVTGPASVVEAVESGHRAADMVEAYVDGQDLSAIEPPPEREVAPLPEEPVEKKDRERESALDPGERIRSFSEVNLGLGRDQAIEEAARCLNCGRCSECLQCVAACEKDCIYHDQEPEEVELETGAVILSPGFALRDPSVMRPYGYGVYQNVVTSLEFERILSSTGPTQGHVLRPSDGEAPRRVAFIQCVGSRDSSTGAGYCSSICCMYATKEAVMAREHDRNIEPTIFYLDMRAFGKGFDRYVDSAGDTGGVRYLRSLISTVKEIPATGNLLIGYQANGEYVEEEFDLVVLSLGVQPPEGAQALADNLDLDLKPDCFLEVDEENPVSTSREGIFLAGGYRGPQDIPETVMTASAAASAASRMLAPARFTRIREKEYLPERDVSQEEPRIGVFVCRCGINIAGVVDVEDVVKFAQDLPGVVHAQEGLYTCSGDSLESIRDIIVEQQLNRVVVASCTIRTHQPLFRETLREAGLNQFLFEMANIRDQCSWVHQMDQAGATSKSKELVSMAVRKAANLTPLHLAPVDVVQSALVVGGGVAGMTSALSMADQGFSVDLVERSTELGGNMARMSQTMDGKDARAIVARLASQVEAHSNINLHLGWEVSETGGHVGHFTTYLRPSGHLANGETRQVEHGVTVLATGTQEAVPAGFRYSEDDRVITGMELEPILDDPESEIPGTVAFIQCAESRNEDRPYCSRTCCGKSVKNAIRLKKRNPDANVYVFYRDIRTYGFYEYQYREAREMGVMFIPYPDEAPPAVELDQGSDRLSLTALDELAGAEISISPDLVVLASPALPTGGTRELATAFKVPVDSQGFLLESHVKLGPMDFASQGIFLAGSGHWPKFFDEAIYQGLGAAARATRIIAFPQIMAGGVVAVVDEDKCSVCLTCVRACPYDVPVIARGATTAEIDPVKCQGCGTCAAECPARAIQLQFYTDDQMKEKIAGLSLGAAGQ